jgi:Spy/CpxP family protein refolding chaperone
MIKRLIAATALVLVAFGGAAPIAAADPSFGPGAGQGGGNNEPHENPGTKCHPPGQTSEQPECK